VNVARASLDELLLDYEDFLRQRGKRQWKKDDLEARQVRAAGTRGDPTDQANCFASIRHALCPRPDQEQRQ
jgi:hypothetical protein